MRILFVALAHDYGHPERGPSFEEQTFRPTLEAIGHEIVPFDFKGRERAVGRRRMQGELVELAASCEPDLVLFVLFGDELSRATIRRAGEAAGAPTVNWFADDHWRFERFTSRYAPAFDWCVTTDPEAIPKYAAIGCRQVIESQWAFNRHQPLPGTAGLAHKITFVGAAYGDRPAVAKRLRQAGFEVECWGTSWPNGRLAQARMLEVFASSRINLNLAGSWSPIGERIKRRLGLAPPSPPSQIKGRTFEVPGCGGFLLTEHAPHLERYFEIGRELDVFESADDLVEKVGWWLEHEPERAAVAAAGQRRVLAEHTYDRRFAAIFEAMGLA